MFVRRELLGLALVAGICLHGVRSGTASAQQVSYEHATPQQLAGIAKDNSRHFGDDPDDGGPIATDLSASLDPAAVGKAMRKVGDWQLTRSQEYFDRIWTWSVLYSGFMAASESLGDAKYRDAMEAMGKKFDWQLRSHLPDADDQSVGRLTWNFIC
jgi:unsaturated rhamnogalacturonyl hydrolase